MRSLRPDCSRLVRGTAPAAVLACVVALGAPSGAVAQRGVGSYFVGAAADGPSADIRSVSALDLARDGAGAVAYIKRDGGEDHVSVAVLEGGAVASIARIDPGLPATLGPAAVAASDGGRIVAAFANAAGVFVTVRPAVGQPFGAPQQVGPAGSGSPAVALNVSGTGYVVWAQSGDVAAAYLPKATTTFQGIPGALDGGDAGGDTLRPRVAAAADGIGVAVWGERDAAGRAHVMARRLVRGALSVVSADATIDPGGFADAPDVGISDDSSFAWVGFREVVDNGSGGLVTRAFARRLRGSAFDEAVAIDGAPAAGVSGMPRVGIDGRGLGLLTVGVPGGGVLTSVIRDDAPSPLVVSAPLALGISAGVPPNPVTAFAENLDGAGSWFVAPATGTPVEVHSRLFEEDLSTAQPPPFGDEITISDAAMGSVDANAGLESDVSRAGDMATAFIQENGDGRRLAIAVYDRSPGIPSPNTTTNWRLLTRPELVWSGAFDLWGPVSYQVLLDGQPYGTSVTTSFTPPLAIADGTHRWQVIATDRRGQVSRSLSSELRVDATPPELTATFSGVRRAGKVLKLALGATDLGSPAGSGLAQLRVDWGDGTPVTVSFARSLALAHAYPAGTFVARLSAKDHAGNATVREWTLLIKKPKKPKKKKRKKGKTPAKAPSSGTAPATTQTGGASPAPAG